MTRSLLDDAFEHHVWATLRVLEACSTLTDEQLATSVPGTFGSILDTLRHTVGADSWYLFRTSRGAVAALEDEDSMDVRALRELMAGYGACWSAVLAGNPDANEMIDTVRDDGSETHASMGLRLAQALHHGSDHRSQICTALTSSGIEPPAIDLWDFGQATGRVIEVPPAAAPPMAEEG